IHLVQTRVDKDHSDRFASRINDLASEQQSVFLEAMSLAGYLGLKRKRRIRQGLWILGPDFALFVNTDRLDLPFTAHIGECPLSILRMIKSERHGAIFA